MIIIVRAWGKLFENYGEMEPYFKGFNHGQIFNNDLKVRGKKSLINKMPRDSGFPEEESYTLMLNSDQKEFGGKNFKVKKTARSKEKEIHGCKNGISINIPAFSALIYKIRM